MSTKTLIEVGGRALEVSSLDRVLWPNVGFTKGDALEYYAAVAPAMLMHIADRPLTLKRAPEGIAGEWWYQTECPHPPPWLRTAAVPGARGDKTWQQCVAEEPAAIVWLANLGCLEFHPLLTRAGDTTHPVEVVFDLDPGKGVGLIGAARVALELRRTVEGHDLESAVKSSGLSGLHVTVALEPRHTFAETNDFVRRIADDLTGRCNPSVTTDRLIERDRVVLIDVEQNRLYRSVVAPYSLRLNALPLVAAPLAWDAVERAVAENNAHDLLVTPDEALQFAPHGTTAAPPGQRLPAS